MEEVEEIEGNDQMKAAKLERNAASDVDETAEELMTDMKLEDEIDEIRATEPGFWLILFFTLSLCMSFKKAEFLYFLKLD